MQFVWCGCVAVSFPGGRGGSGESEETQRESFIVTGGYTPLVILVMDTPWEAGTKMQKTPIILAKPPAERVRDRAHDAAEPSGGAGFKGHFLCCVQ
ncbi:hypothetical protein scyTo_0019741 [Scyliorhinus torazame]|uniref:Uncharacterized protein n=1 Tax=Scyliorhinus torazame TaxID=75743 RepID=A0A401PQ26_SCYTO|nr:hypothetical protein [Scyliorhinus torazame]